MKIHKFFQKKNDDDIVDNVEFMLGKFKYVSY